MERRYARQTAIPEIGPEGERKLLSGSVFIVGAGALGSVVAAYLAGAGIGRIGIADFDTIDLTNLQRQVFFKESALGRSKVEELCAHITDLNSTISVVPYCQMITRRNASEFFREYDVIVDATDNPASKYMTDAVCSSLGKPCVIGGVEQFRGQISTFLPGGTRYRDIFPDLPEDPGLTPCAVAGVIGPAAGVVGNLQAAEVIKLLSGAGEALSGKILTFDLLNNSWQVFEI